MYFKTIFTTIFIFLAASSVYAQNAVMPNQYDELLIREMCLEGGDSASEHCSQWVAVSTCALAYEEQLPKVEKFFSDEQMQEFRLKGEKQLPATCEPLARIRLSIEILNKDAKLRSNNLTDDERKKRWKSIAQQAMPNKKKQLSLELEQSLVVADNLMNSSDFPAIKNDKDVLAFIDYVMNEATKKVSDSMGDDPDDKRYLDILDQIEQFLPERISKDANLILLSKDIRNKQYQAARDRMENIDFGKLTPAQRKSMTSVLEDSAAAIWGNEKYADIACLKEKPKSSAVSGHPLTYLVNNPDHASAVVILKAQTRLWIENCEYEKLVNQIADVWNAQVQTANMAKFMNDFVRYLEVNSDPTLIRAFIIKLNRFVESANNSVGKKYGDRLAKLALPFAHSEFEAGRYDKAAEWLVPLLKITTKDTLCDVQILYGRCLENMKDGVGARQQWSQVIERESYGLYRNLAFELSILSFKKAKMMDEAQAMEKRYKGN